MRNILGAIVISAGFATLLPAQSAQSMRASIRGGGGDTGKCTIEVEVDGAADVEVRGDTGWIRTLQGQPSTWRRFECTSGLPRNPVDFRFRGIDGRGNVQLLRDPRSAGGVAVVRIDDPKGGREGYTFDLEWRGGSDAYSSDDRYGRYDGNYPGNRRNDPYSRNSDPYGRNRGTYADANRAIGACEDAVRTRARREHGVRNPSFTSSNVDDRRGNRDRITGSFEANRGERYDYSCTVNTNNGNIQSVDIRRR